MVIPLQQGDTNLCGLYSVANAFAHVLKYGPADREKNEQMLYHLADSLGEGPFLAAFKKGLCYTPVKNLVKVACDMVSNVHTKTINIDGSSWQTVGRMNQILDGFKGRKVPVALIIGWDSITKKKEEQAGHWTVVVSFRDFNPDLPQREQSEKARIILFDSCKERTLAINRLSRNRGVYTEGGELLRRDSSGDRIDSKLIAVWSVGNSSAHKAKEVKDLWKSLEF